MAFLGIFLVVADGCGWLWKFFWVVVDGFWWFWVVADGGCLWVVAYFRITSSQKISQHSQENTCARVSFLIKLQASGL